MDDRHRTLVLRANELFHDLEGEAYEQVHPEIFEREALRWKNALKKFLPTATDGLTILDIGSGTGFVGSLVLPRIRGRATFICADISEKMLTVATEKLRNLCPTCELRCLKMEGENLALPDASADMITLNSVLHHIPNDAKFLEEIERVLRPNGLLFIGHEPNARFFASRFLLGQYQWFHRLAPKRVAVSILRVLGLTKRFLRAPVRDPLLESINETLQSEGLITVPLSRQDLSMLVDVHSPTAGGLRTEEGFDPLRLLSDTWEILSVETYNHLSKLSGKGGIAELYEKFLSKILPHSGATFFLIARKKAHTHTSSHSQNS